jgi:predicted O-methyltransferase YrrM
MYDFIYIDGSHVAKDVLTDACMAWQILKPQGIMVFDDYLWGVPRDVLHRPKPAIDAFTTIFAEEAEIISNGYQVAVKKRV